MKFLCDCMIGKLARYLRMLGFDTRYEKTLRAAQLNTFAAGKNILLLTRRSSVQKKHPGIPFLFIVRNKPLDQLCEVIDFCGITQKDIRPFSRCLQCNMLLQPLDRNDAEGAVPEYVFHTAGHFSICPCCCKIFWPGTHYSNMLKRLTGIPLL